ncbi:hypothetical protein [Flavobacterium panici]|uniref:Uncharacterized protein n=1 Tax=Flavobacterium panici TaxID=2654843 RepID=A0A9N8IZX6_9FLAO|nr:hypothetical protein [Flavobacterium panici]CAC9972926.1 hypothetical protein FLAPXU55_00605 [Flavobacterium panici]
MTLIYIFLVVILVFAIMSYISLRKISSQSNVSNLGDDRYYELKYKLQFLSSVGVIIIAVAGFFGLDKYENFVKEFKSKTDSLDIKLSEYDKKISLLDSSILKYDSRIRTYDNSFKMLDLSKIKFSKAMISSNKELLQLKDTIDVIKKRNILDKTFYVINNLQVNNPIIPNNGNLITRYYFKDLYTIIGDKLPEFEKPPIILVVPQSLSNVVIVSLTKEYVELSAYNYPGNNGNEEPKTFDFTLLIARKLK